MPVISKSEHEGYVFYVDRIKNIRDISGDNAYLLRPAILFWEQRRMHYHENIS